MNGELSLEWLLFSLLLSIIKFIKSFCFLSSNIVDKDLPESMNYIICEIYSELIFKLLSFKSYDLFFNFKAGSSNKLSYESFEFSLSKFKTLSSF